MLTELNSMLENEWAESSDPRRMLSLVRGGSSERKLRLFVCGNFRRSLEFCDSDELRAALDVSERYADGAHYRR